MIQSTDHMKLKKKDNWYWRDGSAIKSTGCSSKGPKFKSQQPHGGSQPSVMGSDALFWCVKDSAVIYRKEGRKEGRKERRKEGRKEGRKGNQSVDASVLLRRGNKNIYRRKYWDKVSSRDWRKGHLRIQAIYIEPPNPDKIADAKRCMLTGALCSCLLRGSARAWQIQRQMLKAYHWTENGVPIGGVRKRIEGDEGTQYKV